MASSTAAVLTISNKRNCFIKQAGLFNNHPTFIKNYPRKNNHGAGRKEQTMRDGDRLIWSMPKKKIGCVPMEESMGDRSKKDRMSAMWSAKCED